MLMQILYILPRNWISAFIGSLVRLKMPLGLHTLIKNVFIRSYQVNVMESEFPQEFYKTLGEFFIRRLKVGERPISDGLMVSPADGTFTVFDVLKGSDAKLPQVKGREYALSRLLGPAYNSADFEGGFFGVVYLAPYNYHRVHSPVEGNLLSISHLPGDLWPVNTWSVQNIEGLFYRNERLCFEIKSSVGRCILVMVGATNVGRMSTILKPGLVTNNPTRRQPEHWRAPSVISLQKGSEVGCFEMGSTVILVADKNVRDGLGFDFPDFGFQPTGIGKPIRVGESLF